MAAVVRATLHERPDDTSTHWTTRTLAKRMGIGKDTVAGIWRDHELKPWKVDTFKISNDPRFEEKLVDVVGLYLDPPDRAVVFSFDEKTQCQALDRTQPSLPMIRGRAGTMTHDYKRTCLQAVPATRPRPEPKVPPGAAPLRRWRRHDEIPPSMHPITISRASGECPALHRTLIRTSWPMDAVAEGPCSLEQERVDCQA